MYDGDIEKEIVKKGTRGGTYITDDWLEYILCLIKENECKIDRYTLDAVNYLYECLDKADAYDWTEYLEQFPKIKELELNIKMILKKG